MSSAAVQSLAVCVHPSGGNCGAVFCRRAALRPCLSRQSDRPCWEYRARNRKGRDHNDRIDAWPRIRLADGDDLERARRRPYRQRLDLGGTADGH